MGLKAGCKSSLIKGAAENCTGCISELLYPVHPSLAPCSVPGTILPLLPVSSMLIWCPITKFPINQPFAWNPEDTLIFKSGVFFLRHITSIKKREIKQLQSGFFFKFCKGFYYTWGYERKITITNVISLWFTCLLLVSYYWITVIKGCSGQQAGNEAATGDKRGFWGKYIKGPSGNSKIFLLQKRLWDSQPWVSLLSCFIPKVLPGCSWGCPVLPVLSQQLVDGFVGEHWELMSFRPQPGWGFCGPHLFTEWL